MIYRSDCPGGYYNYKIENESVTLTGFGMHITELVIPPLINGYPVKKIARKAFMGARLLRYVSLPDTIEEIGDYAFSACINLAEFNAFFPVLGQKVFTKNTSLKRLFLGKKNNSDENIRLSSLMALSAVIMDAEYLLALSNLKQTDEFCAGFDSKLLSILREPDDDGFVFMVLCGEEDLTADIDEYKEERRKRKSYLCLLRLINDVFLSDENRIIYENYLKEHTCGCESEAAFIVLMENENDDSIMDCFFRLNLINDSNYEISLQRLGDKYAGIKARVLIERENKAEGSGVTDKIEDFFSEFEL